MFTVEQRNQVSDFVLALAASDARVVAGAVVGSLAVSDGDRWSDLDLTFAVADETPVAEVLADWTGAIVKEFGAVHLFDLPSGAALYRVFLLPGCLQFDLSFTPAASFTLFGDKHRLLFGRASFKPVSPPRPADETFGYAVHHLVRARFCIERERYWQAEYWISAARDIALSLACRSRGLPVSDGRGFDLLPDEVRDGFAGALPRSLERTELLRALETTIEGLLREAGDAQQMAAAVILALRELNTPLHSSYAKPGKSFTRDELNAR